MTKPGVLLIVAMLIGVPNAAVAQSSRPDDYKVEDPGVVSGSTEYTADGAVVTVEVMHDVVPTADNPGPGASGENGTTTPAIHTQWVRLGPFPSSFAACADGASAFIYGSLTPQQSWTVDGALVGLQSSTDPGAVLARLGQLGVRDRFGDFVCAGAPVPSVVAPDAVSAMARRLIPRPGVQINPDDHGLAQLETWLWYDGPTEFTPVAATLTATDGTSVTGTANIAFRDICWRIHRADESPPNGCTYISTRPGSEDHPAATHVFRQRGRYVVSTTTRWTVTFAAAGASTPGGQPVEVTSSRPYDVTEVRAVRG